MTGLKERIAALISATGPISVADYFALCLSDPSHGYYMSRQPFGSEGDFTTAPEVSQMFGELVGAWLVTAWRVLGRPERPVIAEIGPGRGMLAKDIIRTLRKIEPDLLASASLVLIETSPRLRDVQAETLRGCGVDVAWHDHLGDLPRRPLLIVGNEFFDALPVRRIRQGGAGLAGAGGRARRERTACFCRWHGVARSGIAACQCGGGSGWSDLRDRAGARRRDGHDRRPDRGAWRRRPVYRLRIFASRPWRHLSFCPAIHLL